MCCLAFEVLIEYTDVQRFVDLPVSALVVLHLERIEFRIDAVVCGNESMSLVKAARYVYHADCLCACQRPNETN